MADRLPAEVMGEEQGRAGTRVARWLRRTLSGGWFFPMRPGAACLQGRRADAKAPSRVNNVVRNNNKWIGPSLHQSIRSISSRQASSRTLDPIVRGKEGPLGDNASMRLKVPTPSAWVETVLKDFDSFLLDHASCERKASATAMTLALHYPDRRELVTAMIELAQEELSHFARVYDRIAERGLILGPDSKDPYVGRLAREFRQGSDAYFLDRLLISGIVEARGCERFGLVAEALPEGPMKEFYRDIASSEARHRGLFLRLARIYFPEETIARRLVELLDVEGRVIAELPLRSAVH